jgi:hypothetical protein
MNDIAINEIVASSALSEPSWVPRSPAFRSPDRAASRMVGSSLFSRRDLSDEALRRPAEPSFSSAELQAIRQDGVAAGHAAGLAEAAASRAQSEVRALEIIASAMADAREAAARVADLAAASLARTLIAAMHAVMPDLIQRSALNEVGAMLGQVLPGLAREPTVRIEVPRKIAGGVEAALATLAPEHRDKISVVSLDHMAAGDARVTWASGRARRQPDQVWQAVMEVLRPALGEPGTKDNDDGE